MAEATLGGEGALPGRDPGAGDESAAAPVSGTAPGRQAEERGPQAEERGRQEPAFEEALEELAGIVRALETGELGLDRSLELFQRGIALARLCHRRLDEIERKIEWLLEDEAGRPYTEPAAGLLEEAGDR